MPRVLIIKTSSMGDVVHNLPAVSDIQAAYPGSTIDWVVEEAYADLPRRHSGIDRVLVIAQRRWRKSLSIESRQLRRAFATALSEREYDTVLDTQGLLKSALIARQARLARGGKRVGFSFQLAREGLARAFYDRGFDVDPTLHAIERIRALAAQALGYQPKGRPVFGLQLTVGRPTWLSDRPYAVLLHATSRPEKSWPDQDWRTLASHLAKSGLATVWPHGNEGERAAAVHMAAGIDGAIVPALMPLGEVVDLLGSARLVVGVDTGLTHVAAALGVSTVALFGATPRWRYAPYWSERVISLGDHGEQPSFDDVARSCAQLGIGA